MLPLFKSLMQEVHSHMTVREREQAAEERGACMCVVWRNWDPCTVMFKQRFPWQPHAPLVPLSKLWDEAPQLPLILMHVHTRMHSRALNPQICKGISTFDWGWLCTNGSAARRDGMGELISWLVDWEETLKDERQGLIYWKTMLPNEKERLSLERTRALRFKTSVCFIALTGFDSSSDYLTRGTTASVQLQTVLTNKQWFTWGFIWKGSAPQFRNILLVGSRWNKAGRAL